jgi:hypothetical protein
VRVPQELLRSTPRHVALTATGKAVTWIAVCLLAAGLVTSATLLALARRGDARYGPGNVPLWVSPLVFLSLVSGGVGLLVSVRRQTHLLSYGRATVASVTTWRKAGKGARRVGFRYDVLSGATHTSSVEIQKNAPPPGSEMIVLYDPDNPRRRGRYPLELVRCVAPY